MKLFHRRLEYMGDTEPEVLQNLIEVERQIVEEEEERDRYIKEAKKWKKQR